MTPGPNFIAQGRPVQPLRALWRRLLASDGKAPLLVAVGAGLLAALLLPALAWLLGAWGEAAAAATVAAQRASAAQPDLTRLAVMLALGGLLHAALLWCQSHAAGRLGTHIANNQARLLAQHLIALPARFFVYRLPDKLHEALYSGDTAAQLLADKVLPAALGFAALPVCLLVLAWLSPAAAAAVALLGLLCIAAIEALYVFRGDAARGRAITAVNDLQALLFGRSELEASKLGGKNRDFLLARSSMHVRTQKSIQGAGEVEARQRAAALVFALGAAAIVLASSTGALTAQVASAGNAAAMMMLAIACAVAVRHYAHLRRDLDAMAHLLLPVEDVLAATPETAAIPCPPANHHFTFTASLPPGIALRATALSFGYSASRAPLIHNVSLSLATGEQLGLTGPSGGGKSTLAGLLAGARNPWSGTLDIAASTVGSNAAGSHCPEATAANAHQFVAWVDKSAFFFDGTIRENLCLWQTGVPAEALQRAISDACLDDVLAARPGGLDAPVIDRGSNFSGGQRQRLEIARALLCDPAILILDEATDALEPALEVRVRANLRRRGCTLVMVSHRASTLAGCDRVLRVEGGTLVESPVPGSGSSPVTASPGLPAITAPADTPAGPPVDGTSQTVPVHHADSLLPALQLVAKLLGASAAPSHADATHAVLPAIDLVTLARRHGLHARTVRFIVPAWWQRNASTLIAWRRDTGAPVVVVPTARRLQLLDPETAQEIALPPEVLQPDACAFDRVIELDASPALLLRRVLQQHLPMRLQAYGLSLLLVASLLVLPAFVWRALDTATPTLNGGIMAFGLAALIAAVALIDYCRSVALLRATGLFELAVNSVFAQKLPALTTAFLARTATADIGRSLIAVQRWFERVRGAPLQSLLNVPLMAAVLTLLAVIDARAALAAAMLAALAVLAPWALSRSGLAVEAACQASRSAARRFLFDLLSGIFRLRLLGASQKAVEQWLFLHDANLRREKSVRAMESRTERQAALLAAAMLPLAVPLMALAAELTGGQSTISSASLAALPAILLLIWILLDTASGIGAAIVSLLRTRPLLAQAQLAASAPTEPAAAPHLAATPRLELHRISYRYAGTAAGTRPALDQISLAIEPGQFIAITGPSGSGKSTLMRLLAGLECADSGERRFNGALMTAPEQVALRQRIGMVSQDERLQNASTLRTQISGYATADVDAVWRICHTVLLAADISRMPMGLQTIAESSGVSTGQAQRLMIARELLRSPQILILDEATNAIPDSVQAALFANLRQLGITCILVTHRETAIAEMDRVLVLEHGSIVWDGSPGELEQQERLAAMLRAERQEGHL